MASFAAVHKFLGPNLRQADIKDRPVERLAADENVGGSQLPCGAVDVRDLTAGLETK